MIKQEQLAYARVAQSNAMQLAKQLRKLAENSDGTEQTVLRNLAIQADNLATRIAGVAR